MVRSLFQLQGIHTRFKELDSVYISLFELVDGMAESPGYLFTVSMADEYEEQKENIRGFLEEICRRECGFSASVIRSDRWKQVYLIIYRVREARNWKEYFQKNVVTGLCRNFPGTIICVWIETKQLTKLTDAMIQAGSLME